MILNLSDELGVVGLDEVDGDSLSSETTGSTDSVDVVLLLEGELVVDNKANLLHIDTSGEEIGGNEDTCGTGSELLHDGISLELVHLSVHSGNGEVVVVHGLLELKDSLLSVTVDESLVDVEVGVEIEENLHLPLFLLDGDVVLADTIKGEVLTLHEDLLGVSHEVLGKGQDVVGHGSGEQADLNVPGEELEDLLDLLLEASGEHLIGLVHDEQAEVLGLEESLLHHVVDSSRGSDDDLHSLFEELDVFLDAGSSHAGVDLNAHVLSNGVHDEGDLERELSGGGDNECLDVVAGGIDALQGGDGEGTSFTRSRLRLRDGVVSLDDGQDALLLNGRRLLETVSVNSSQNLLLEAHVIESLSRLFPIRLQVFVIFFLFGLLLFFSKLLLLFSFGAKALSFLFLGFIHFLILVFAALAVCV
mmetsp:Transcript_24829/g.38636  ORF Transcript_24829/g.38636 Transcript_24829/m.38636 type:complete len:418 (-) Transcript_24829:75-1328(-)